MITHSKEKVGQSWQGWSPGDYQVHFIHTGVGEAIFHIFPDGTTMLIDCGDHPALTRLDLAVPVVPNPGRLAGSWVARYISRVMPENHLEKSGRPVIDYMMISHFHDDHTGDCTWQSVDNEHPDWHLPSCYRSGLALVAEQFSFGTAIDRGWPDYDDPYPGNVTDISFEHVKRLYAALRERDGLNIEKFRLGAKDQIVPKHTPVDKFCVTNITANGKILCRNGEIKDLYAYYFSDGPKPHYENGMSLGVIIRYGKFSIYLNGDFSSAIPGPDGKKVSIESLLAQELPQVDVAKINHHGHFSMPGPLVSALAARAWTACIWDQLHTVDEVMERLSDRSLYPGERMHFPCVFPYERVKAAAGKPFMADIAQETIGMGAHVIVTVPPGGESFKISCLSAEDENMTILGEYLFE